MHLNIPMELENSIESSNALHGIDVKHTGLGNEDGSSVFGFSRVKLGVIGKVEAHFTSQCILRVGIIVIFPRRLVGFCGFLDHFNSVLQYKLTSPKPTGKSPYFTLDFSKGINRLFGLLVALVDLCLEFELKMQ